MLAASLCCSAALELHRTSLAACWWVAVVLVWARVLGGVILLPILALAGDNMLSPPCNRPLGAPSRPPFCPVPTPRYISRSCKRWTNTPKCCRQNSSTFSDGPLSWLGQEA
ncbi:hypothetical protein F5Y17DRAFT_351730 [Xylariaceae sp. FL0594]|nr:hypothetical protein F5Y17DRAFT_351730 [Xylariaceae sp. FL0594]